MQYFFLESRCRFNVCIFLLLVPIRVMDFVVSGDNIPATHGSANTLRQLIHY